MSCAGELGSLICSPIFTVLSRGMLTITEGEGMSSCCLTETTIGLSCMSGAWACDNGGPSFPEACGLTCGGEADADGLALL